MRYQGYIILFESSSVMVFVKYQRVINMRSAMFNNHRKTVGVFINRSENEFQQLMIRGLVSEAQVYGFNIAFMDSYGIRESNNMYDYYESTIVSFAPIEEFDAVIVALDTYDTPILRDKLIEALQKRAKCPVISFREENNNFYCTTSKANSLTEEIVQHFVKEHGVKRFGFMAGYPGHIDSEVRFQSFHREIEKQGLTLEDNSVFHGDMWKGKGEEAYQFFFGKTGIHPEAIVCANDFMARALCDALLNHGLKVPQDVYISGFDNIEESYNFIPRLTTVSVDYELMARESIQLIDKLLKGEKCEKCMCVPAKVIYRESCCQADKSQADSAIDIRYNQKLVSFRQKQNMHMYFSIDMDGCTNYDEMYHIIQHNLYLIGEYRDFYLCLFDQRNEDGILEFNHEIPDYAILKMACHCGMRVTDKDYYFERKELLPAEFASDEPFIGHFILLHNRSKCFGYTAVSYKDATTDPDSFFHNWNLTVSLAINELSAKETLMHLSKKNEKNSITDFMTGLLNRRGLEQNITSQWNEWVQQEKQIYFFSIDLDRLKYINDTFGHKEGDRAIYEAGIAIRNAAGNYGIVARTGGDEFEVVMTECDNIQTFYEKIEEHLAIANEAEKRYQIEISAGCFSKCLNESDNYEKCIQISDAIMYKNKKQKKQQ